MKNLTNLMTISLTAILFCFATFCAASDTIGNGEHELIASLARQNSFTTEMPGHDPFKPIISKKETQPVIIRQPQPNPALTKKPEKEIIEPLRLKISGICGNNSLRQAIISHRNEELTVQQGQIINGVFKVIDINANSLVVYSIKEEKRHKFTLAQDSH